jgi:putative ABC transport system permease protein
VPFLLSLAARNLARNVRRTLLTSTAVVAGVALMIFGWGLIDGLDDNILRAARLTYAGDLVLRPDGYPDDGLRFPLDQAAPIPPALQARLDAAGDWTARATFPGRLVKGAEAQRVFVVAYDPATEARVFDRASWRLEGRWPAAGQPEIVAGSAFARLMELHVGDEVVIEARTRDGAINALTYTVVGLVRTDNTTMDNLSVWMEMPAAEQLAGLGGVRTSIAVRPREGAEAAKAALAGLGWTAWTLPEECDDLIAMNRIRRRSISVVVGMIMLIAATGIANTVIMAAFERIREIGTLLALGMRRRDVQVLFLLEGGVMGLGAGLVGAVLGSALVLYWQVNGMDFTSVVEKMAANMSMSVVVYTRFSWAPTLLSLLFGVVVAVLASVWPARYASRIVPADAVRAD